jgi:hypothetical protein
MTACRVPQMSSRWIAEGGVEVLGETVVSGCAIANV